MRLPIRSLGTLVLALGVATCSDAPRAGLKTAPEGQAGRGRFSLSPRFSPQAAAVYAQRATFAAANFDHVRIVITRPPNDVVIDTIITFNPASPPTTLDLFVDVKSSGEIFDGAIQYTNNGAVVYQASAKLQSYPPDQLAPTPQELVVVYVGPGATATRVVVTPATATLVAPGAASFTATAFDASNTAVANVPITWSVSDASIATLSTTSGPSTSIATAGKRGSVTITAASPTLSGSATVTVSLPPSGIALVSGGGQTGKAGSPLANPGVVRVTASDGLGVAGVAVQFAAPTGGSVGSASATTDAQGQASSSLTLGSALGPQSFAASAAGFSVSIPATATPGDPTLIAVVSGSGQTDTVSRPLKAPFVVKVSDRFGNGISGITVSWAKTSGGGTLAGATSVTGGDGTASMGYTLGATVGAETVTASAAGLATPATFTATAITGPAAIAAVSGSGQTGRVGQALPNPLVVKVTDAAGNGVGGVVVFWAATNGTVTGGTSTDAQGQTSATFTLGTAVGAASATASVNTSGGVRSATFGATVQPGTVARAQFKTGPSAVVAGAPMVPAVQVELQDAGGNRTNAVNAVSIALGANPGQATLGGTLTRTAVGGVATFDDLTLSAAGTGYTLVVSSAGVPSITSGAFAVTAATVAGSILFVDQQTLTPITTPPASVTMTAGVAPTNPPAIRVLDLQGVPIANATVTYVVTRGQQTLFSGAPQTNAQGVITFATLAVSPANMQVAGNYAFVATLQGATGSPLTLPVTVVPAAAAKYVVTASTATPAASAPSTLTAQLADQYNNAIANGERSVSWTLAGSGGGTLAGAGSSTNGQGQATMVYTAAAQPSGATVTVTAIDVQTPSITGAVTLTPQTAAVGPGTTLRILTQPSPVTISLQPLTQQPSVQLIDANGNAVATPTPITIVALWPTGSERNNSVQTNAQGIATFTNLAVVGNGTGPIVFSGNALTPVSSNNVTSVVAATALQFQVQPSNVLQGAPIAPQMQVRVVDGNNNTVTTANSVINLGIGTNPGSGNIQGTISVAAVNGIATFTNVLINNAGNGYTITASSNGLTTATSNAFNVVAPPDNMLIVTQPSSATQGQPVSPQPVVRLTRLGNSLSLAGVTVTASIVPAIASLNPINPPTLGRARVSRNAQRASSNSMPPLAVTNATAVTDANGVATFTNLTVTGTGYDFRIAFDASGPGFAVTATTTNLFLAGGPAAGLVIDEGDNQTGGAGSPLPNDIVVRLVDAGGNTASTPSTLVTFSTSTGSVSPTTFTIDGNSEGFAHTTWTMPPTPGPATLTASATINGTPVSLTFHATATSTTPASLTPVTPITVLTVGASPTAGPYPSVRVRDASSNPIANVTVTFYSATGNCSVGSGYPVDVTTDASGIAALSAGNISINTATAGSCFLVASTSTGLNTTMSVVVAPTTMVTWLGSVSTAWNLASNWHGGVVPTATDQVFIPGWLQNQPALGGPTTVAALTGESAAAPTIFLGNFQLTVNGSLSGQSVLAATSGSGSVLLNAPGAASAEGVINAPVSIGATTCTSQYTVPVGVFLQTGPLTINCQIEIPAVAGIVTQGNVIVQGSNGRLVMNNGSSSGLTVNGDLTFDGAAETGLLTQGSILVGGNMTIGATRTANAFFATNDLVFNNGVNHTITIAPGATGASFGALNVFGGTVTVTGAGNLTASGTLVGAGGALVAAGTVRVTGALGQGGGSYAGVGQLMVTGATFPEIDGPAPVLTILSGATVTPFSNNTFGGSLEVRGRLNVTSNINIGGNLSVTGGSGEISINNSALTLTVAGNVTFAGRASTLLQAGILAVGGNFNQVSTVSTGSFRAAPGFITRFNPAGVRTVTFADADSAGSYLGIVRVVGGGIDFASRIVTFGDFSNSAQVQFLTNALPSRIGGSFFFNDPSRTVIQSGAFVQIFGAANYGTSPFNVVLQLNGSMQVGSCVGRPTAGPNVCG